MEFVLVGFELFPLHAGREHFEDVVEYLKVGYLGLGASGALGKVREDILVEILARRLRRQIIVYKFLFGFCFLGHMLE